MVISFPVPILDAMLNDVKLNIEIKPPLDTILFLFIVIVFILPFISYFVFRIKTIFFNKK